MFSIDNRNKITLTKGDLASFDCLITDMDNKVRVPVEGDELVFSIDGTDFSKTATIDNNEYVFTFNSNDTKELEAGVYYYRVVLNSQFTIIQDCFIELLGDGEEEEEPAPEPEPEEEVIDEPQG